MTGTIQRAFELAADGSCRSLDDIRRILAREQHSQIEAHLAGTTIRKQLKAAMTRATVTA